MTAMIKVCRYFIRSAPVGELHEVLDDIGKVLGSQDFLTTQEIKDALRDYYETHKLHLHLSNGQSVLVANSGRQEPLVKYVQSEQTASYDYQQQPAEPKPVAAQAPVKKGLFDGDDDDEYGNETQQQQL